MGGEPTLVGGEPTLVGGEPTLVGGERSHDCAISAISAQLNCLKIHYLWGVSLSCYSGDRVEEDHRDLSQPFIIVP